MKVKLTLFFVILVIQVVLIMMELFHMVAVTQQLLALKLLMIMKSSYKVQLQIIFTHLVMVVLVGIVALVASIMILWWLARTILDSPRIMQRFFQTRKQDRGYKALSKGLIAANSGDAAGARRYTRESIKLLG